jgi:hypothetical protein
MKTPPLAKKTPGCDRIENCAKSAGKITNGGKRG